MKDELVGQQVLIIPYGAGPNDPSTIIGAEIPAAVAAFYAPGTVVSIIVNQQSASDYVYQAYVDPTVGTSFWAVGGIESVSLILREAFRVYPGPFGSAPRFEITSRTTLFGFPISGSYEDVLIPALGVGTQFIFSTNYVDFPGPVQVSMVKTLDAVTDLLVDVSGTFYSAVGDGIEIGVNVTGVGDFNTTATVRVSNSATNSHTPYVGKARIPGLAAGTYTVRMRWRSQSGVDIRVDGGDNVAFSVSEVAA